MTAVTLLSRDDIYLIFQIGVVIEFAALAVFFVSAIDAMLRRTRQ